MKPGICIILLLLAHAGLSQDGPRRDYWRISAAGGIVWDVSKEDRLPHTDNIEMSGTKVSAIVHYGVNRRGQFELRRDVIFPQLRTFDKTNGPDWQKFRAYRRLTYSSEVEPNLTEGRQQLIFDKLDSVRIDGKLIFYHAPVNGMVLTRTLFPSMTDRLLVEKWTLSNRSSVTRTLHVGNSASDHQIAGYKGTYRNKVYSDARPEVRLQAGESYTFGIYFAAALNDESLDAFNYATAEKGRDEFLFTVRSNLALTTSDPVVDQLFYFSKIRAAESIFESKMGLVHSPGGGNYYLGVWANDQAEYSGPFFPLLGYDKGIEAARNAYDMFLKHIPPDDRPIPYSFEIEGEVSASNKDRGDAAMIAYGASQFLLRAGDGGMAKKLWPLIAWCLDYCNRKLTEDGVVASQTDEMEGRISTGNANLATSALYYGGLKYASFLAKELGHYTLAATYEKRRRGLEKNIESHFGATIEGLNTYRYFDGNTHLRHWICLPLAMGINTRAEGTATALLEKLWTNDGVLVELNPQSSFSNVFWDRGTLYVLRGTFKAGHIDKSAEKLHAFSASRLLGKHVPYVVEAYPENDMRHLSAESALYCMILIEGVLGLEQTGFNKGSIRPSLNAQLSTLKLDNLHLGNNQVSIELTLHAGGIKTIIDVNGKRLVNKVINNGDKVDFTIR